MHIISSNDVACAKGPVPVDHIAQDVNGYLIYESRAIARYIAEKYADQGTPLIPKDMEVKGLFEQAASVEQSNFEAYAAPAIYENVFMP